MSNDQPSDPLSPRKLPAQGRAAKTVDTILDAAADVLDRLGLEGYNTNYIADRAGVSIGSLYQYFPSKDAVTAALIERGHQRILSAISEYDHGDDWRRALEHVISVAAEHQLSRPQLARLLDYEESRLSISGRDGHIAREVHGVITQIVSGAAERNGQDPAAAASDVMALTRTLSDAASERGDTDMESLRRRISRAAFGYLEGDGIK
ncbi:TetR/AcrR family transcriptional regulator [Caballeronia sp. dw_19]|jgi:AcrR family transcriptional regulator|uniref:TetR/AcrR family transcriptional regulator n=1 Tax=unclassified Caballeronia TaxID=2646786 RepID=UPI001BD13D3D|nr:TetR/AcrR family transcriptional regulator [Caballeronia sp. dw_19]